MTKKDKLVTVELNDLDEVTEALVNAIIHEGELRERERILTAIETAPPSMDFFGPYIAKDKLVALIKGDLTWSEEVTEMKKEWSK
jgi:hypothetical protein